MAKAVIILASKMGIPAIEMDTTWTETQIANWWKAYLQTCGIEVRNAEQIAQMEGFDAEDIEKIKLIGAGLK